MVLVVLLLIFFFFFKQKTAYEMRISDWSSDVCSSDLFRCIAPDQRGYRGSSKPQDAESYTPDKLIADIFALADALDIADFTIVGHDWGGAIAWGVALGGQPGGLHPAWAGRVTRAVLANAPQDRKSGV